MTDQETISVYDKQVGEYTGLVVKQPDDPIILDFISRVAPNGLVLDLGCGPAQDSAVMRDHGLRVDPVDASGEMVREANEVYDIGARQALFEEIDALDAYDGIWANFSLLHATATALPDILLNLRRALKPTGVFHLGMKIGSGSVRDKLGRFYSYYSEEELCDRLTAAGFVVDNVRTGEAKGLAGDVEPWIVITSVV